MNFESNPQFLIKMPVQGFYSFTLGLLQWLISQESICSAGDSGDAVPPLGREDPLEKDMATHSSILAWRIPWTEEPGGLQSMGLQRVGHD